MTSTYHKDPHGNEAFKTSTVDYNSTPYDHQVTEPEPKQPGKLKRHFRKFWWLHLINFVLGTILISMILYVVTVPNLLVKSSQSSSACGVAELNKNGSIQGTHANNKRRTYVALPSIAQNDINKAEMFIIEQILSDPTPEMVTLQVVSQVKSYSMFRPDLDAFNAALFLEDTMPDIKPFGMITIPKVHATKLTTAEVIQKMRILDQDQFNRYNALVVKAKTFRLAVRGRTSLHLGALPVVKIDFNKVVDMKGFNGFAGIEVNDIKISLTPDQNGNNMNGTIMIPNPTVMTITIGDMVQDIYSGGKLIGNTTIKNMYLKPGKNYFPLVSSADQLSVIEILTADKTKSGILPVEAVARTVTFDNKRLPYFEYAMSQTPVKLNLNLKESLTTLGLNIFDQDVPAKSASAALPKPPPLAFKMLDSLSG